MADSAVRVAIRDFFTAPEIDGIQKVYLDVPWFVDGAAWEVYDSRGWAAIASVHLDTSRESRITVPWKFGSKQVQHTVGLLIQYQYLVPVSFAPNEAEDAWVEGFDQIIDAIKDRIRSDYTMASSGIIFQAGQDNDDIRVSRDVPTVDVGRVVVWCVVEFNVTEIIQA